MDKKDNRWLIGISMAVFLFFLTACIWALFMIIPLNRIIPIPFTNDKLKTLTSIDRIEIYGTARDRTMPPPRLKIIDDPDEVNAVVEKVRTYAEGWQYPGFNSYYTPEDPVIVYFYRNGETTVIFDFGIGHQYGKPYIATIFTGKYLSEEEFKELMRILDIDEALTYN